ncbi:septum site-determining protein MinC [Pasteurella sp. PK-2025]|uniref:septum site-determining protein MinC n=1 Tax=unclassified Pasteurella TaxID=2621516 RepID=UPI003C768348
MAQDIIAFHTGQCSSVFMTLNSASLHVIQRHLNKKIKHSPAFFNPLAVILQFTPSLEKIDLNALKTLLADYHIQVIGVADWQNDLQKELILSANLPLLGKSGEFSAILPEPRYFPVKIIDQTVSKNQVIYAKKSDLIIHGDVEEGAEVAADGNIHIYGKLQGRAMAGVNANSGSIYTQYLDAEFIAVNNRFLYKEKIPADVLQQAVRIFAEKEKLGFQPF